jgi:hypothetical protein
MTPELQAITRRLEEAEKQIAHLAALVVEQSDADRTVTAKQFIVKDKHGKHRAGLGMVTTTPDRPEEDSGLVLLDENENIRAHVGFDEDGVLMALYGVKNKQVAEVREWQDGPRVALFDESGSVRACLKVSESGAFAYLYSPNGKQNLRLELHSSGLASLVMQDTNGEPRLILATETDEGPTLTFFKDGEVAWTTPWGAEPGPKRES